MNEPLGHLGQGTYVLSPNAGSVVIITNGLQIAIDRRYQGDKVIAVDVTAYLDDDDDLEPPKVICDMGVLV